MADEAIAADLLRTGAFIVAFGDPGQLPPVNGKPFFTNPDFVLHQVVWCPAQHLLAELSKAPSQ
jgi:hypothetical protein